MFDCWRGEEKGGDADMRRYTLESETYLIGLEFRINDQQS